MTDFKLDTAEIFIPDYLPPEEALARTTHMAIGAHPDDIEVMAIDGILKCFQRDDLWFTGVIVTNGSGSPRDGIYKDYTDEEMRVVRAVEQKKAAILGEYAAQILLDYPSSAIKDSSNKDPINDMINVIKTSQPNVIYTHNLADKHDTHVAVTMRVIEAIRELPIENRPLKLYACEAWRDLDWMLDEDKAVFDCSRHVNLQSALLSVFDSQISGGKRYDLAIMGRRRANATYYDAFKTDTTIGLAYAMDLTPLIIDSSIDIPNYIQEYIENFRKDVMDRISKFS